MVDRAQIDHTPTGVRSRQARSLSLLPRRGGTELGVIRILGRRGLPTYFHLAGIDRVYGYFAPNIPGSYKLVFELRYPDGRVDDQQPSVSSKAAGLRLASLLDEIGRAGSGPTARISDKRRHAFDLARSSRCRVYPRHSRHKHFAHDRRVRKGKTRILRILVKA